MQILYGVVGEGMGHATRSRVILEHLLVAGHDIRVVVSGRAHDFLVDKFKDEARISIDEIHGLTLKYEDNELQLPESIITNLAKAPKALVQNVRAYAKVAEDDFKPDVVISDFESWAYFYGVFHDKPVISIDNMQVINRCKHSKEVTGRKDFDFLLAKLAVKTKMPGAHHYVVTSFFYPPIHKPRTTLVPPILRPEVLAAKRVPGRHVIVYQRAAGDAELIAMLRSFSDVEFRVYGMGREGREGNVQLCGFSEKGFVDDLRTARAVIAGGGYSLMGEAVHLHVPMLSVPIEGQYEQELNARYLRHLGYGTFSEALDTDAIGAFLERTDEHSAALESYEPQGNRKLFGTVDGLLTEM